MADNEKLVDDSLVEEWHAFIGETPMQKALAEFGLTPALAAEKLMEELNATYQKVQIVDVVEVVGEGDDVDTVTRKDWSYSAPLIDWPIRQRARQDLLKLWGSVPKSTGDIGGDAPTIVELRE